MFCRIVRVVAFCAPAPDRSIVTSTSTRSPGTTKPETEDTRFTVTDEARMLGRTIMDRPPPMVDSLLMSTGSFVARKIFVVWPTTESRLEYAFGGTLSFG